MTVNGFSIEAPISRRQVCEAISTASLAVTTSVLIPEVANADVTNKVASSSAIRVVKSAQKQLDTLEFYAANNQYKELVQAVQSPPLTEIRKACTTLIRGGEDERDADKLVSSYQNFISSLEKMYTTAGLGIRGRTIPQGELLGLYNDTVSTLSIFAAVAEDSVSIPLKNLD